MSGSLRVVVATPLSEENCAVIESMEPRLELVRDQELLPPMRYPADFAGDPSFSRTPEQRRRFEQLVDSAEVLYGIPDADVAELKRTVDANAGLRWVQAMAAGAGGQVRAAGLDDEQLKRVAFTTSAGVHGGPLSEFAVLGVLAGAKGLPRLQARQRDREWAEPFVSRQVAGSTILVVGLGHIGRATATRFAALGATVIGTSRRDVSVDSVARVIHPDDIATVASDVDAVVVTLPGTDQTEGLVGAAVFEALKPGATVVNVGRGTVIDETAMIAALRDGRVGYAALDVFASEPLAADSPLWAMPNVLVSPHTAAVNTEQDRMIAELFARNATRFLDGQPLENRVDTVEFY